MSGHTHDGLDWASRIPAMRAVDALEAGANRQVASRIAVDLPAAPTVIELGPGTGGMSASLATVLAEHGGGRLVLADAVPELLAVAAEAARAAGEGAVEVVPIQVDAASDRLSEKLPSADLVWAAHVIHHLPDQQGALTRLAGLLNPGGLLALAEGGLGMRCLPWDLGVGEPGLEDRLIAARDAWFADMRASMDDVVRLTIGWNRALLEAGLQHEATFSFLVDHPAPATEAVRASVARCLTFFAEVAADRLAAPDLDALDSLLDADGPDYVGARDDVFMLAAVTVHCGRAPARMATPRAAATPLEPSR